MLSRAPGSNTRKKNVSKKKNLTGQTFGSLTVIRPDGKTSRGQSTWLCRCACGRQVSRRSDKLGPGKTQTCGECKVPPPKPSPSPANSAASTQRQSPQPSCNGKPQARPPGPPRAIGQHRQQDKLDEVLKKLSGLVEYIHHTLSEVNALLSDARNTVPDPVSMGADNRHPLETELRTTNNNNNGDDVDDTNTDAPVHPVTWHFFLTSLDFVPDTPGVPNVTPQRPMKTAPLVHRSTNNGKPAPVPETSKRFVDPTGAFSFPNINIPHEVGPAADAPGQFNVTVTLHKTPQFLGQYASKPQAHFAVRCAILLDQILTPSQRKQQDILLETDQIASIAALEHDYDFDGRTKDEIKAEVALHLLDINQTIIWTSSPLRASQVQSTLAALAKEIRRARFSVRSTMPCLGH